MDGSENRDGLWDIQKIPVPSPVSPDNVELVEIADGMESLSLMSRLRMCAERLYGAVVWRLCTA